jgi:ABC-type Zn2+ transport system substrate-binding protein/surface adhesin
MAYSAVAEELVGIDELEELWELKASESEDDDEEYDDDDEDDEDEEDEDDDMGPEDMPSP